eukprot:CAMPEP_0183404906 /NCGR_PEP_ID=MMETSP0370-20130417/15427_1 /TAXON_ID=268820 /ORGANISM="Peridinium aciculiferum, Strain PAER-2" /LENGTH=131 /DNA_ID=CAMNT_0025586793 /DNA_START=137 /DNA_END=529 /DNA_ORIENTATION=-
MSAVPSLGWAAQGAEAEEVQNTLVREVLLKDQDEEENHRRPAVQVLGEVDETRQVLARLRLLGCLNQVLILKRVRPHAPHGNAAALRHSGRRAPSSNEGRGNGTQGGGREPSSRGKEEHGAQGTGPLRLRH